MPIFNGVDTLDQTLNTFLESKVSRPWKVELIVVNDGSTDKRTGQKLSDWIRRLTIEKEWLDAQLVELSRNEGQCVARNVGFKNCTSKNLIAYLDCDDLIHPKHLDNLFWMKYELHPTSEILFSPFEIINEENLIHKWSYGPFWSNIKRFSQKRSVTASLGLAHTKDSGLKMVEKYGYLFPPGLILDEFGVLSRRLLDNFPNKYFLNPKSAGKVRVHDNCQAIVKEFPESGRGYQLIRGEKFGYMGQYLDNITDYGVLCEGLQGPLPTKICNICKKELLREEFAGDLSQKDWKKPSCKECLAEEEAIRNWKNKNA